MQYFPEVHAYLELKEEGLSPGHDERDEQNEKYRNVLKTSIIALSEWPTLGRWGREEGRGREEGGGERREGKGGGRGREEGGGERREGEGGGRGEEREGIGGERSKPVHAIVRS